jgi:hypothetical protein
VSGVIRAAVVQRFRAGMTRQFAACLIALMAMIANAQAPTVHWRLLGSEATTTTFLATGDEQFSAEGHPEVWTKQLSNKEITAAGIRAINNKARVGRIADAVNAAPAPIIGPKKSGIISNL